MRRDTPTVLVGAYAHTASVTRGEPSCSMTHGVPSSFGDGSRLLLAVFLTDDFSNPLKGFTFFRCSLQLAQIAVNPTE